MHCGVEVTESSTNKQHTLSLYTHAHTLSLEFGKSFREFLKMTRTSFAFFYTSSWKQKKSLANSRTCELTNPTNELNLLTNPSKVTNSRCSRTHATQPTQHTHELLLTLSTYSTSSTYWIYICICIYISIYLSIYIYIYQWQWKSWMWWTTMVMVKT